MSGAAQSLASWDEFEASAPPPAAPVLIKLRKRIERLLEEAAGDRGVVMMGFPYRPVLNLEYWMADVAYLEQGDWDALPPNDYPVYAPGLIVEMLSPTNTAEKIDRQRMLAMAAGTREFWVVDLERQTVYVSDLSGLKAYGAGEEIPLRMFGGPAMAVDRIFAA